MVGVVGVVWGRGRGGSRASVREAGGLLVMLLRVGEQGAYSYR